MAGVKSSQVPISLAVATDDLPWADDWLGYPGLRLKVLLADVEGACYVVRIRFAPGSQLLTHLHIGTVHAFTLAGEWTYLEYPDSEPSRAGSYLYEPAGSTHTLKVADHNTEDTDVIFISYGAMVIYDEDGTIVAVRDAAAERDDYLAHLREQGKPVPQFIEGGHAKYTDT
jgi:2,4'-dihydroxyacetophenone dioxygenase